MLGEKELEQLTHLCRIECSEEEKKELQKSLNSVLGYIDQLKEVDTSNTAACYQVLETLSNVFREDIPYNTLSREEFLKNAPSQAGGMIKVPPVIHFQDP